MYSNNLSIYCITIRHNLLSESEQISFRFRLVDLGVFNLFFTNFRSCKSCKPCK